MYDFSKNLNNGCLWRISGQLEEAKEDPARVFLASSLGRLLARSGKKTLLIDLDLGAANLHTMVDVPYPEKCFSDFVTKKIPVLEDTVLGTPFPNLFLISGAHDNLDIANLPYDKKIKTLKAISKLKYEYILLDLGAGTAFNTLDFFLASRNGIFITTPEPTSIENVYRLDARHLFPPDSSLFLPQLILRRWKKKSDSSLATTLLINRSILFPLLKKNIRKNTC